MPTDEELAWAAGVFEGDGTVCGYVPRGRKARVVQVTVYQATTPVLERFQRAMNGHGAIYGPYRQRLYHWTTKKREAVATLCAVLWPQLSREKREQMSDAVEGRPELEGLLIDDGTAHARSIELAWAAGFFDAEGSVTSPASDAPVLELPQAAGSSGDPSPALVRFHAAVGVGRISGPRLVPSPWSKLPQYRWTAGSRNDVEVVAEQLAPYLGAEKRGALVSALAAHEPARRQH